MFHQFDEGAGDFGHSRSLAYLSIRCYLLLDFNLLPPAPCNQSIQLHHCQVLCVMWHHVGSCEPCSFLSESYLNSVTHLWVTWALGTRGDRVQRGLAASCQIHAGSVSDLWGSCGARGGRGSATAAKTCGSKSSTHLLGKLHMPDQN